MVALVDKARAAVARHDWSGALELLGTEPVDLTPDELVLQAEALWWDGRPEDAEVSYARAYARFVEAGRRGDASVVAAVLAYLASRRDSMAVANGWLARLNELLEGLPESLGHVWNLTLQQAFALFSGDLDRSIELSEQIQLMARTVRAPSLRAISLSFKGYALIEKGDWREGLRLVDEATVVALSEGSDLRAAADVYCNTIAACRDLGDYRRASEWTEEAERWMQANSIGGYPGICQVHRAELKRLWGHWNDAENEARKACRELERYRLTDGIGFAQYEIGEVRRRMGDLDGAERVFAEALEHGYGCQPGLSLLLLDQGNVAEATRSIDEAVERAVTRSQASGTKGYVLRSRLLPAQVLISLAAGDVEKAGAAVEQLEEMATVFDGAAWEAAALASRAAVALHKEDHRGAQEAADRAWRLWSELDMPYEAALARVLLGRALVASGHDSAGLRELTAARATFDRLGARIEVKRIDGLIGGDGSGRSVSAEAVDLVFMFTDIVTSTDLIGVIGDTAWQDLLEWHDRELRRTISSHSGTEVRHTGDGFFVTFAGAREAIDCAVTIQRRLARHRSEHGFAPRVRIGIHRAAALRHGNDYAGQGVHEAARIGSTAQAEEIVVSEVVIAEAGPLPYPLSDPSTVALKGISEPAAIRRVDWT